MYSTRSSPIVDLSKVWTWRPYRKYATRGGDPDAHQFKRAHSSLRKLKTYLGRVIRDITSGQNRRVTPQIKREFKRRAAIEPVIFAHASGDAINAVLAAAGYNFRRLLAWLRFLWLRILIALGLAAQLKLA